MLRKLIFPWWNAVLTVVTLVILLRVTSLLFAWAVSNAAFGSTPESCAENSGACWSLIYDNLNLLVVGLYPQELRWRPYLCLSVLLLVILGAGYLITKLRIGQASVVVTLTVPIAVVILHGGEWIGFSVVTTDRWGGLTLTFLVSVISIALALPLGVLLALGRTSKKMPVIRLICVGYTEMIRGVPLISVLFLAAILLPLFLPRQMDVDLLVRAVIGISLFQSAYLAEVVRGGLQAIPSGQIEAAHALGMRSFAITWTVVLPQALSITIPSIANQVIIILKDTSLLAVIGIFDLLGVVTLINGQQEWLGHPYEAYLFVGLIYWAICFSISRLSMHLESRLANEP